MNSVAAERAPGTTTSEDALSNHAIEGMPLKLDENQREVAQYVADMILELRNMAKSAKLYKIMVPLEFAYYEAFSVANRVSIPKAELERLQALAKAADKYEPPASAEG